MKSWSSPDAPHFSRLKSGVAVTVQSVVYLIPWVMWDWIKLSMGDRDEQARPVQGWPDEALRPATDAEFAQDGLPFRVHHAEAREQEVEGRHEGLRERDALRDGAVQERRIGESVGDSVSGPDARSSGVQPVREDGSTADGYEASRENCLDPYVCCVHYTPI